MERCVVTQLCISYCLDTLVRSHDHLLTRSLFLGLAGHLMSTALDTLFLDISIHILDIPSERPHGYATKTHLSILFGLIDGQLEEHL